MKNCYRGLLWPVIVLLLTIICVRQAPSAPLETTSYELSLVPAASPGYTLGRTKIRLWLTPISDELRMEGSLSVDCPSAAPRCIEDQSVLFVRSKAAALNMYGDRNLSMLLALFDGAETSQIVTLPGGVRLHPNGLAEYSLGKDMSAYGSWTVTPKDFPMLNKKPENLTEQSTPNAPTVLLFTLGLAALVWRVRRSKRP